MTTVGAIHPVSIAQRVARVAGKVAALDDVKHDVQANHDDNRWWPTSITDPRTRMLAAGWSTRISYTMIETYAAVIARADTLGFDRLAELPDADVVDLVRPLGLTTTRLSYLRSLTAFLRIRGLQADVNADTAIARFAADVEQASYKVAQCALLYARGYHCGIIPVDSGMITRLAPVLGLRLSAGPIAHEQMRGILEAAVNDDPDYYRRLTKDLGYQVSIPDEATPTWWLHLVLIYFKRRYLNRNHPRVCAHRPVCERVIDCGHHR